MATTLGISPGTRHIGIAVFHDRELVEWRVLSFKGEWSKAKRQHITTGLQKIFTAYALQKVAVKVPDILPASKGFGQTLGVINVLCERQGIRARYCTLTDLKLRLLKDTEGNKDKLTALVAARYPELLPDYRKSQRAKVYYYKIFEAVAAGLCTGKA